MTERHELQSPENQFTGQGARVPSLHLRVNDSTWTAFA